MILVDSVATDGKFDSVFEAISKSIGRLSRVLGSRPVPPTPSVRHCVLMVRAKRLLSWSQTVVPTHLDGLIIPNV